MELISEAIFINRKKFLLLTDPLKNYLSNLEPPITLSEIPASYMKNGWKGYTSVWELKNDALWLNEFYGVDSKKGLITENESNLFKTSLPIKADWFSGNLEISLGADLRHYVNGFETLSSKMLEIQIISGVVTKRLYKEIKFVDEHSELPF